MQHDPDRQAVAAMKAAAEARGAERLEWIRTALAWKEVGRLRSASLPGLAGADEPT